MFDAWHEPVLLGKLGIGLGVIPTRIDEVGLFDITPAVTGFRANMVGEQITPFRVHLEVAVSIAGGADDMFQLASSTKTQPARQQFSLGVILRLALVWLALVAQFFDPIGDRIVVAVGDNFSRASDVSHKFSSLNSY